MKAYKIAIEKLSKEERSQIDFDAIPSSTIHSVIAAANEVLAERDENKWKYTNKHGEVVALREKFDKIVKGFAKYIGLLGKTIQHQQPEVTSLVWGGAQSLIEVSHLYSSYSIRVLTTL
jgi:hypothetical protein